MRKGKSETVPIPGKWCKVEVAEVILSALSRIQSMRRQKQKPKLQHPHIHKPQVRLPGLDSHIQKGEKYNGGRSGEALNFGKGRPLAMGPPICTDQ